MFPNTYLLDTAEELASDTDPDYWIAEVILKGEITEWSDIADYYRLHGFPPGDMWAYWIMSVMPALARAGKLHPKHALAVYEIGAAVREITR